MGCSSIIKVTILIPKHTSGSECLNNLMIVIEHVVTLDCIMTNPSTNLTYWPFALSVTIRLMLWEAMSFARETTTIPVRTRSASSSLVMIVGLTSVLVLHSLR